MKHLPLQSNSSLCEYQWNFVLVVVVVVKYYNISISSALCCIFWWWLAHICSHHHWVGNFKPFAMRVQQNIPATWKICGQEIFLLIKSPPTFRCRFTFPLNKVVICWGREKMDTFPSDVSRKHLSTAWCSRPTQSSVFSGAVIGYSKSL